jgi:hypothetical protein
VKHAEQVSALARRDAWRLKRPPILSVTTIEVFGHLLCVEVSAIVAICSLCMAGVATIREDDLKGWQAPATKVVVRPAGGDLAGRPAQREGAQMAGVCTFAGVLGMKESGDCLQEEIELLTVSFKRIAGTNDEDG